MTCTISRNASRRFWAAFTSRYDEPYRNYALIKLEGVHSFYVTFALGHGALKKNRVTVGFEYTQEHKVTGKIYVRDPLPEITVNALRPARSIAADIVRKLLPKAIASQTVMNGLLDAANAKQSALDAHKAQMAIDLPIVSFDINKPEQGAFTLYDTRMEGRAMHLSGSVDASGMVSISRVYDVPYSVFVEFVRALQSYKVKP